MPPPQKYGRALVVLPYVSIVNEKSEHLAEVLAPMHATVRGFSGGAAEDGAASQPLAPRCGGSRGWAGRRGAGRWWQRRGAGVASARAPEQRCRCPNQAPGPTADGRPCSGETVAVCTIEKANVAINRLVQEERLGELCCVVVGAAPRPLLRGEVLLPRALPLPRRPAT